MFKLIIWLHFLFVSASAFADTPKEPDVWLPVARQICGQTQKAVVLYQQGDIKKAHLTAVMSYFKGYDTEMEPAVRITLGGPHVFAVERQFRDFAEMFTKKKPDQNQMDQVKKLSKQLCETLKEDALVLNKEKVKRQVFTVN